MNRIITGILVFAFTFSVFAQSDMSMQNSYSIVYAEDSKGSESENKDVMIDTKYLKAGEKVIVKNAENYQLKWYVDNKHVSDDTYTPNDKDYEKWIKVEAYDGKELRSSSSAYLSRLPVIYLNTEDGKDITSKKDYKSSAMTIQNNDKCDEVMFSDNIQIKGRGNSSWTWPKKAYKIKLDSKTDLLGMGKNKHWVLLANYLDESLIRNTTAFQISEKLGLETMSTKWVDVVLNGSYAGNYQLCEQIRIGKERVDIFDWEDEAENIASAVYKKEKSELSKDDKSKIEDVLKNDYSWVTSGEFKYKDKKYTISKYYEADSDISGGYLFELSDEYDEVSKFTTKNGLKVMSNSPEFLKTNKEMTEYTKNYWQSFEDAYRSEDGYTDSKDKKLHYTELADLDSMVSYWLTMEIMGNNDSVYKSRFAYKDKGEKLVFGPVWDFDWGCSSSVVSNRPDEWKIPLKDGNQNFYKEWLDDPLFIVKATEKYWSIRDYLGTLAADDGLIESEYTYLYESGIADEKRWPRSVVWPGMCRGFSKDFNTFKSYFKNRLDWLDEQFASDTELLKSTYSSSSACPYKKSDEKLVISAENGTKDTITEHAPADCVIGKYNDLKLSIAVNSTSTESLNIFVNGKFNQTVKVKDGKADLYIDNRYLTEDINKKNVISVIGKDNENKTTYKNFTTVTKADKKISSNIEYSFLSLSGNIGLNLYAGLSNDILSDKSAYVKVIMDGQEADFINVSDLERKDHEGKTYSVIKTDVKPSQVDTNITYQIYSGYKSSKPFTVKVNDLVSEYQKDEKLNKLVSLMSAYGTYSAIYFNDSKASVSDDIKESVKSVKSSSLQKFKHTVSGKTPSGIEFLGSSLVLRSRTAIRLYFKPEKGKNIKDYSFKLDNGSEKTSMTPVLKDDIYYVEIPNISAANLGKMYTVTCGDFKITYSAMSYAYSYLEKGTDDKNLEYLLKAMYLYYKEAYAYKYE